MEPKSDNRIYYILVGVTIFTLATGTVFYHLVEKFSWLDAYYFSVTTLTTVGFGDFSPHTTAGKIFTTFYILIGVGIITTFITYTTRRRAKKVQARNESRKQVR